MGLNDPGGFDFAKCNVRINRGHSPLCGAHHADGGWAWLERSCQNNTRDIGQKQAAKWHRAKVKVVKGLLKKHPSEDRVELD